MAFRGSHPFGPVGVPGMFNLRREIDRLFEDAFGGAAPPAAGRSGSQPQQSFTPAVDAREEERDIVLHMDLPGVRPEDVDLSVEHGLLTVRGQRHQQRKEGQDGRYQFVERSYGSFARQFHLPQGVDESQISASFEHGELTIRIPKPQQPQPRKIQIGTGAAGAGQVGGARQASVGGGSAAPGSAAPGSIDSGPTAAGPAGGTNRPVENGAGGAMGADVGGSPAAGAGALGGALSGVGGPGATGTMAGSHVGGR